MVSGNLTAFGGEAMAIGLINKLTNFLMPLEEEEAVPTDISTVRERKQYLRVHAPTALKILVDCMRSFEDTQMYAEYLKTKVAVMINFEAVDDVTQQRAIDFLDGVNFILGGSCQRVSSQVTIYAPANVDISKELYGYTIPTYVKEKR